MPKPKDLFFPSQNPRFFVCLFKSVALDLDFLLTQDLAQQRFEDALGSADPDMVRVKAKERLKTANILPNQLSWQA